MRFNDGSSEVTLHVLPSTLTSSIFEAYARKVGGAAVDYRFNRETRDGARIPSGAFISVSSVGLNDGDLIIVAWQQIGGKPVIYLFPPFEMDVSVDLSLCAEWSFSALYPVVPIFTKPAENVHWEVHAQPNGDLVEKNTNREVSYLFWEAQ